MHRRAWRFPLLPDDRRHLSPYSSSMARVYLYSAGDTSGADLAAIKSYLSRVRDLEVIEARDILSELQAGVEGSKGGETPSADSCPRTVRGLAHALARTRVHDINRRDSFCEPLPAEIAFLERHLRRSSGGAFGYLYDAMAAMSAYRSVLRHKDGLALVFTRQILGTWNEGDLRYHARVLLAGSPSIVSITGAVIAPARPREYYLYQGSARAAGVTDDEIEIKMLEVMGDRFLVYEDPRTPEVLKGYALQAVAYWIFGEGFCEDPDCRLYNAHWQEEMLRAQLGGSYELCERHSRMLGLGSS